MGAGASPYGFVMFDTDTNGTLDLAYIADDRTAAGGGLQKWTFNGTSWSRSWALLVNGSNQLSGTAAAGYAGLRGLTGSYVNGTATLYATTSSETSNNRLISIVDTGTTPTSATLLATAGANFAFRGTDFSPVAQDTTAPTLTSLNLSDEATGVAIGTNLVATFIETIAQGRLRSTGFKQPETKRLTTKSTPWARSGCLKFMKLHQGNCSLYWNKGYGNDARS